MKHDEYLTYALRLARQGKGFCAPNPAVGAVLVKNDQILGEGYHQRAGAPHAEIHALQSAPSGATLYVTLEPCCHTGRTPPCTEAILAAGITHVYFAYQDPNPKVSGLGQRWLQERGIVCEQRPLSAIDDFYQSYHYWTKTQRPWISAKLALSFDGKIAGENGTPIPITSPALLPITHQHRQYADAILTTATTILHDNPKLNVRLNPQKPIAKKIYVLDRQLRFPLNATLLTTAESITLFYSTAQTSAVSHLSDAGIRCIAVPETKDGLDLTAVCHAIGQDGIHDLWVETGGRAFAELLRAHLLNEAYLYLAPKMLGPTAYPAAHTPWDLTAFFNTMTCELVDQQLICHFTVDKPNTPY